MTRNSWDPEALQWLAENRKRHSVAGLTAAYNDVALQRGWPRRTQEAITQQLSKRLKIVVRLDRPVKNLDSGEVYPSLAAAARDVYVAPSAICKAVKQGTLSAGVRWAYVDELEDQRYA